METFSAKAETAGLRRPLGLVLAGGGALGAWQAAALLELERSGLTFDSVLGFSAGSLNGAAYFLGITEEAVARWSRLKQVLRFSPRLAPPSLFSDRPIWTSIDYTHDDAAARGKGRCRLVIPSARWERDKLVYAEFDPRGSAWDGPLASHLMASCAIPIVFPPVDLDFRGSRVRLLDGGVPCREPFSFAALGACADVIVLEMVRADEIGRKRDGFFGVRDQRGREGCRRLIDEGCASLGAAAVRPRLFRVAPSRVLPFSMLDFGPARAAEGLALGVLDARRFLADPSAFSA